MAKSRKPTQPMISRALEIPQPRALSWRATPRLDEEGAALESGDSELVPDSASVSMMSGASRTDGGTYRRVARPSHCDLVRVTSAPAERIASVHSVLVRVNGVPAAAARSRSICARAIPLRDFGKAA